MLSVVDLVVADVVLVVAADAVGAGVIVDASPIVAETSVYIPAQSILPSGI